MELTIENAAPMFAPTVARKIQKGLVLILEDQRGFRRVYRDVLEQDGYQVLEATNGEEGWETILTQKPDLVLLDLGLPLLDGFQVLEKIRRSEQTKNIPVIVFSVLGEPRDVKKALDMGANDYSVKGFYTPRQVLSKIRGLLKDPVHRNNLSSYRLVLDQGRKGAMRMGEEMGLQGGCKCPSCDVDMEVDFFPDYARSDGHWFAARFVCPSCEKPF